MKRFCLLFVILLSSVACFGQWTLTATPKSVVKEASDGKVISKLYNMEFTAKYIPAMPGQAPLLMFTLAPKGSNTGVAAGIFFIPKTTYFYEYMDTKRAVLDRVLWLFSSATTMCVSFFVPTNYKGGGSVFFTEYDKKSNKKKYSYEVLLYEADAKRIFLKTSRSVRDLNVRQSRSNSLYIDVDF